MQSYYVIVLLSFSSDLS